MTNTTGPWRILRVVTSRELFVLGLMKRQEVESFVPTYQGRPKADRLAGKPLFPGYVFARYDPQRTVELISSVPHTIGVLRGAGGVHALLEEEEASRIRIMADCLRADVLEHLVYGQPVRIISGPLRGHQAIFVRRMGSDQIVCNVAMLGRSVAARVEREMIEPVGHPGTRTLRANAEPLQMAAVGSY